MQSLLRSLPFAIALCAAPFAFAAEEAEEEDDTVQVSMEGDLRKVTLDLNGDKRADVFNYYKAGDAPDSELMVRKEIDLNFDGRTDVTQTWDDGRMTKEEIDADFDGRKDWTDYYDVEGARSHAEWDTDFDGRPDLTRYFKEGKLSKVEMDTDGNGAVDYWEYYEGGVMKRSGWDTDGDGKIDKWGEV